MGDLDAGFSKSQMFQALADERQKEFILEEDRWFDMVYRGFDFLNGEMNAFIPNAYLEKNRDMQV
ncbi:MAG: RagB/SusD family nutrient uptake outer membrane protein [Cyclobacteriaceae bacterium]